MKVIDLNLLLYAVNRDSPQHAAGRSWLEESLSGEEPVGFPWAVLFGFLRLTTSARVFQRPLVPEQAVEIVGWLARPHAVPLAPGERHWEILRRLIASAGTGGNLTTDAHLAALAIEHDADLYSTDADFGRFATLRWVNPLAGSA